MAEISSTRGSVVVEVAAGEVADVVVDVVVGNETVFSFQLTRGLWFSNQGIPNIKS